MRSITFLTAARQLTKTYYADGRSEPYPLVREFTSLEMTYDTLEELKEAFTIAAGTGACVLKGKLTHPITNEPRVGLTDPTAPTDLLVVDYDSDAGFDSVEELLAEIDPQLPSTDYIFQHSASAGIKGPVGVRGHVFILLETPVSPAIIKQWLRKINLTSKKFRSKIKLSRNSMALCYALDTTVCQNDKLIYIAPPKLVGLADPVDERFELVKGSARTYAFNAAVSAEHNRMMEHELLEALQDASGLPKRTPRYKTIGEGEIITNPAVCAVTGVKDCGKFVRINLNGGDSYAYWFHKDNPEVLYNFKGEPYVYLKDVAPEYYEQVNRTAQQHLARPFVFRDMETDTYFNAEVDESTGRLVHCYKVARRATLIDFMVQRGLPAPKVIPDWTVLFNPNIDIPVNFELRELNLFRPTKYLSLEAAKEANKLSCKQFPTIERVLRHICVDEETYKHFVLWIAFIVQYRTKTQTAWVFSGTEGTGKGTLFHKILTPIFSAHHCHIITQDQAEEQFNDYLRHNMILFLDEGDIDSAKSAERIMGRFRSIITEPTLPLRSMRANSIQVPNYSNVIIATNKALPIRLTANDRRYNVAPRQDSRLYFKEGEYEQIDMELGPFVQYLKAVKVDRERTLPVMQSEARDALIELSKTVSEDFFEALKSGDLDFFVEHLRDNVPIPENGYIEFARIIQEWMKNAGRPTEVSTDELLVVYKYIGGNMTLTTKRLGHAAGRAGFTSRTKRVNGIQRRVYEVTFAEHDYSTWLSRNSKDANIIPLRGKKS